LHYVLTGVTGGRAGLLHAYASDMAQNFYGAIYAFVACLVITTGVSLVTRPRDKAELTGLVYSLTPRESDRGLAWYRRPLALGLVVLAVSIALNIYFW
jgi:solute:Na+ symporter, SSS family